MSLRQDRTLPGDRTARRIAPCAALLRAAAIGANLTTDAHIAAFAIEHAGTVYSNDSDFARFDGLRWKNPLAS